VDFLTKQWMIIAERRPETNRTIDEQKLIL